MPYISKDYRSKFDPHLVGLKIRLLEVPADKRDGVFNYCISYLLNALSKPDSYYNFNRLLGVLNAAALEFYRRRVAPYEDKKKEENGDVYR